MPAAYTKGADAMNRSKTVYQRKTVSIEVRFVQIIKQVETLVRFGVAVNPVDFYPPLKKHKGKSRDLPMVDGDLRHALKSYLKKLVRCQCFVLISRLPFIRERNIIINFSNNCFFFHIWITKFHGKT